MKENSRVFLRRFLSFLFLFFFIFPFFGRGLGGINQSWALPKDVEVWFLSTDPQRERGEDTLVPGRKMVQDMLLQILPWALVLQTKPLLLAEFDSQHLQCQRMGEEFFHPQLGLHSHLEAPLRGEPKKKVLPETLPNSDVRFLSNEPINLIDCDPNSHFDLFCGKGKKEQKIKTGLEIFVDTSASLRAVDAESKSKSPNLQGGCFRRSFVERLQEKCLSLRGNLSISLYNTHKKSMGSTDSLCLTHGLNDAKRLMSWIEDSEAKKLVVITDIAEYTFEFGDFLEKIGAKIRGDIPGKLLYPKDMLALVAEMIPFCSSSKK